MERLLRSRGLIGGVGLFGRLLATSIRVQAQYPASALLLIAAQFVATFVELIAVFALLARFGRVQGWSFGDVAVFYALVNIMFAVADMLARGFDVLGTEFLRTGAFDRLLLRPRAVALQLIGHEVRLSRLGRLLQGLVVLGIATRLAPIQWSLASVAIGLWAVAGGIALFFGILVLQGAFAFWTIESLELANVLTYGGVQAAQYPLSLYSNWFRAVLTYAVPLACVAYFPVLVILGRPDPLGAPQWFCMLAPLAGFIFLGLSFIGWRIGIRHYTSSGS